MKGSILDQETQVPIPGATVVAGRLGGNRELAPEQDFHELVRVQTDEAGRFKLSAYVERHSNVGPLYFRISKDGYEPTGLIYMHGYSATNSESPRDNQWRLKKVR